jgi:glycosyltransferase involved in cell wall biosynthesis
LPQLPQITIVTPSFNQAKYLPETIESILNQDYPRLEYIIIDGGSTDGSVEIIKKYQSHLSYWVREKDSGQSEAINKGFSKATGDLFNWINSDDILFPGALCRIAEAYIKNPNAALIAGYQARSDSQGRIFSVSVVPSRTAMSAKNWIIPLGQQSTFIASKVFEKVGGVREDLHCIMDSELYYRICMAGGSMARAKGFVGMIREHPEAKGVAEKDKWGIERAVVFKENNISIAFHELAKTRMRLCRLVDGSYLRSFMFLQRLKGKKPWQDTEHMFDF